VDDYYTRLLQRAQRAFQNQPIATVTGRARAIIGPAADKMPQQAQEALDALKNGAGKEPSPEQLAALELAIRMMRPSVLSKDGQLPGLEAETAAIFPAWVTFSASIRPFMHTIGRVEQTGGRPIGSGFLVAPTVLVTNKHVLDELSFGTRRLQKGQARVLFREEYNAPTEAPVDITSVIAVHPSLDMALLAVEGAVLQGRPPMAVETQPAQPGESVVAVGYPFEDKVRNPLFVGALFGSRFGVKRAAPGEVTGIADESLFHDCSTLGGNSGSPIVSMSSARVVGIHRDGYFTYRNEAVNGESLSKFIAAHV
jgi:S1-C subfamily serine protease